MSHYIDDILGPNGLFAKQFAGYEARPSQIEYAKAIDRAFTEGSHLLAEAPCGVGKSFGYLLPAIHHATTHGKRIVVVTGTIALQEQLVEKDLPLLASILPGRFSFALLKGRANFLCAGRHDDAESEGIEHDLTADEVDQLEKIREWAEETDTGDVSELDVTPSHRLWSRVCGDREECDGKRCAKEECFARQARDSAKHADILVANYHLLFANAQVRAETDKDLVIPAFDFMICDEGHEMADIARDFNGFSLSPFAVTRLSKTLKRIGAWKTKARLREAGNEFFRDVDAYGRSGDYKARFRTPDFVDGEPLLAALESARQVIDEARNAVVAEADGRRLDVAASRIQSIIARVQALLSLSDENSVYFIEKSRAGPPAIAGKTIDVASYLREQIFEQTDSVIVTSATLTSAGSFDFLRREIGAESAQEIRVESPFRFREQALLVVPEIGSMPNDPSFLDDVATEFERIIDVVGGKTLGLFTSYKNLHAVANRIRGNGHVVLVQGERPRSQLLEEFKRDIDSVLLGTSSFWQGIDVPGDALTCVVIDRLPFTTPDDPVIDALAERDRDWFMHYSIPRAVLSLRQGFGRLIRSRTDRGVVVILDRRIVEKPYGQLFIRSLPECPRSRRIESIGHFLNRGVNHANGT